MPRTHPFHLVATYKMQSTAHRTVGIPLVWSHRPSIPILPPKEDVVSSKAGPSVVVAVEQ